MDGLNLGDLVRQVRDELEALDERRSREGKAPLFALDLVELEINFTVSANEGSKGGFDVKVVTWGADANLRREAVQTVKLTYRIASDDASPPRPGARAHASTARTEGTPFEPMP